VIRFEEQAVVVTGAGRGLGRLYVLEFARRGARVVVNDLGGSVDGAGADQSVADQVVREIKAEGGDAVASYDSVETPAGGKAIVSCALDHFGRIDAVVSNAGIFSTPSFEDLTSEQWRQMLRVHLDGAFHLGQSAFRVMKGQGYGRLVFIASSAGLFGQPNSAHYAAAKAGTVGLANVIAIEGEQFGVKANTVLPFGYSRMVTSTLGEEEAEALRDASGFMRAIEPELVVPMVIYLASRSCEFTHRNYSACAGRFARVFIGLGDGWVAAAGSKPTAEDIETHLAEVSATEPFIVPASIFDEVADTCGRLGITA
jgi:NAD(P)-dependent dehydrogenase (short-subunit alcohol dehydrogenase family)